MTRKPNTDRHGNSWTEETKMAVFMKGVVLPNYPENTWRQDKCGKFMKYSDHGNRESQFGWEIDHIDPIANGGGDNFANLQPLNWINNADKADKLDWSCQRK